MKLLIFLPHSLYPHQSTFMSPRSFRWGSEWAEAPCDMPKASREPDPDSKPGRWTSHPFVNVSHSNYTWLAAKLNCSFSISAETQIQRYSSVFLLFSDQKMLYLCTLAKFCSLKVQIEKGIDCSFPQAWMVLWFQKWTFRRKKCVFPALAPGKFRKTLKTKTDNEMMLLNFLGVICAAVSILCFLI